MYHSIQEIHELRKAYKEGMVHLSCLFLTRHMLLPPLMHATNIAPGVRVVVYFFGHNLCFVPPMSCLVVGVILVNM